MNIFHKLFQDKFITFFEVTDNFNKEFSSHIYSITNQSGAKANKLLAAKVQNLWNEVEINQKITWRHVRAHRGHRWNERADHLANRAVQKRTPEPLSFWKPGMR